MQETTSTTEKNELRQKDTATDWFETFEHCYGIKEDETDRLKPLKDLCVGQYTQHDQEVYGIFCNEVTTPWYMRIHQKNVSYTQFRTEGLTTEKDAYEIIGSCQYVLDKIYDIHPKESVSVNLRHTYGKKNLCVEIRDAEVFSKEQKRWLKRSSKQSEPRWIVSILYDSPRMLLMAEFLKKCFQEELERRSRKNNAEDKDEENSGEQETAGNGNNKAENDDYVVAESQICHLTAWLVSNCLYTLGELVYAELYIAEYQERHDKNEFTELCEKLGVPWRIFGKPIKEILCAPKAKNGTDEDNE